MLYLRVVEVEVLVVVREVEMVVEEVGIEVVVVVVSAVSGSSSRLLEAGKKLGDAVGASFLWYSSVQTNAITNSSYRWTPALGVPTLPMLSFVLWPEDMRNFIPCSTLGGLCEVKPCCRSPNLEESSASQSRALLV